MLCEFCCAVYNGLMKTSATPTTKEQLRQSIIAVVRRKGLPEEFGALIADSLGTEKTMTRMLSYLVRLGPASAEEIADEMLAIKAEFEGYRRKKINEYYNIKMNQLMNSGPLDEDEDDR